MAQAVLTWALEMSHASPIAEDRPPRALRGYTLLPRYYDRVTKAWTAQIIAGQLYVSGADEQITTVLGSCVAVCMRDPRAGLGGMNHFLLPGEDPERHGDELRYGRHAIEHLIAELEKNGGQRQRFETQLFGGGRVIGGTGAIDIGAANIEFARRFLKQQRLAVSNESLGGGYSRRVRFHPLTGEAHVKLLGMGANR